MADISVWVVPAGAQAPGTPRALQSGVSMFTWTPVAEPMPTAPEDLTADERAAVPRQRRRRNGGGSPPSTPAAASAALLLLLHTPAAAAPPPPLATPLAPPSRAGAASHWPLSSSIFYGGPGSRGQHAAQQVSPPSSVGLGPALAAAALSPATAERLASAQACLRQCEAHHVVHMSHIGAAWPPANSFLGPHLSVNTGKAPNGGCHGGHHAHA